MEKSAIDNLMDTAMVNIKSMIDADTIIGKPITVPDGTFILPISKVGFGFGAGGSEFGEKKDTQTEKNSKFGGGCGGGASISPVAFLVVSNGSVRLIPMDGAGSSLDKVIDMIPEVIEKVNSVIKDFTGNKDDESGVNENKSNSEE